MYKVKRILEFYMTTNKLKDKMRSGPVLWHVNKERLESVAEHTYGVCMLAIAIDSEYEFNINIKKVILMLTIHELEECYIGDLTPFDNITKEEKRSIGEKAVAQILDGMVKKEEYFNLTKEYNDFKTKEAKFSHYCDKLEMMLQMKIYEEEGYSNLFSSDNKYLVCKEWIKQLINDGSKTISDLFFNCHQSSFEGDEVFESIANYAKTKKITNI